MKTKIFILLVGMILLIGTIGAVSLINRDVELPKDVYGKVNQSINYGYEKYNDVGNANPIRLCLTIDGKKVYPYCMRVTSTTNETWVYSQLMERNVEQIKPTPKVNATETGRLFPKKVSIGAD